MRQENESQYVRSDADRQAAVEEMYKELHAWVRESGRFTIPIYGQSEGTAIWLQGAEFENDSKRPQLIMEEASTNQGLGLDDDKVKLQVIEKLAKTMPYPANEMDWFYRDENGQIHSIDVSSRRELQEHPNITDLRRSGDLNRDDFEEARRIFPDQFVNVLSLRTSDATAAQLDRLDTAFAGRANDSLNQVPQNEWNQKVNEPELPHIDLRQESFSGQLRQPQEQSFENEIGR